MGLAVAGTESTTILPATASAVGQLLESELAPAYTTGRPSNVIVRCARGIAKKSLCETSDSPPTSSAVAAESM